MSVVSPIRGREGIKNALEKFSEVDFSRQAVPGATAAEELLQFLHGQLELARYVMGLPRAKPIVGDLVLSLVYQSDRVYRQYEHCHFNGVNFLWLLEEGAGLLKSALSEADRLALLVSLADAAGRGELARMFFSWLLSFALKKQPGFEEVRLETLVRYEEGTSPEVLELGVRTELCLAYQSLDFLAPWLVEAVELPRFAQPVQNWEGHPVPVLSEAEFENLVREWTQAPPVERETVWESWVDYVGRRYLAEGNTDLGAAQTGFYRIHEASSQPTPEAISGG